MERVDIKEEAIERYNGVSHLNNEKSKFVLVDGELGKIYTKLNDEERNRLERRINYLQEYRNIKELVLPTRKIYINDKLFGFTQYYYKESESFKDYEFSCNSEYLKHLKQVSDILKLLHSKNIIVGDLSFRNILIGNEGLKFIDLDGCGIAGLFPEYLSALAYDYVKKNSLNRRIIYTKQFDLLALYIEFICYQLVSFGMDKNRYYGMYNDYIGLRKTVNSEFAKNLDLVWNYFNITSLFKKKQLQYLGDVIKNEELYDDRCKILSLKLINDFRKMFK